MHVTDIIVAHQSLSMNLTCKQAYRRHENDANQNMRLKSRQLDAFLAGEMKQSEANQTKPKNDWILN